MGSGRSLWLARIAIAVITTLGAGLVAWWIYDANNPGIVIVQLGDEEGEMFRNKALIVDPEVGHRLARNVVVHYRMKSLAGGPAAAVERRTNDHGCIAEHDFGESIPAPRVVVLGDSHTSGVVSTADNVGPVLQRGLRAVPEFASATVMNAGAGYYSLYQYLLRARQLLPRYRPQALVVVVFLGNDFLELEDVARPHLTDELVESPPSPNPPPETTTARRLALELTPSSRNAFWQGLNQAAYLLQRPERRGPILRKADYVLREIAALAAEHDTHLLVAVLPPFDLVFPEHAPAAGPRAVEVVRSGVQGELHGEFLRQLASRGIDHVDLLPAFREIGDIGLYATDFHIWKPGHAAVAAAVLPRLRAALAR